MTEQNNKTPTSKKRGRPRKKKVEEETVETPKTFAEILEEEDRISPIVKIGKKIGPSLGVETFLPDDQVSFRFIDPKRNVAIKWVPPKAVRVVKEGGLYNRVEFYYDLEQSEFAAIPPSKWDGVAFVLQTGVNPETKAVRGRLFDGLVCSGWLRGSLPEFPEERLTKYVCHTKLEQHFNDGANRNVPKSLKGLGVPRDEM